MGQKKKRKWDPVKRKWAEEVEMEEHRKAEIATSLLTPAGKNPYYLIRGTDCIAINNLAELKDRIDMFMENEAGWVASWIEYLGDKETADKIRATPNEFKGIISARYEELSGF
ncbi:MAG: hypothetical protein EFT35_06710 [Methanophagales archaeon ANME-1-THS]|nr:MAG: hypothetical protein EFT35_06710 [Methanophagales archaeon ANME-1-THS]